jgi:sn-glycerol 3-phosphate transport system substrate-binding protein
VKEGTTVKQWGVEIPGDYWNLESLIMQNGGQLSNSKGTQTLVDQQPAVEALQFMADLSNKDGVMPQKRAYPDSSQDFVAGQAAMIYNTPGGFAFVRDSAKFQFGVAPLPAGKQQSVPTGGAELVVFAKAPAAKKEAAWKFISWLTAKEQAARWSMDTGYVPVRKSAMDVPAMKDYLNKFPQVGATFEAATFARREQMGMHEGAKIMQFINTGVQQALAGQKAPQDALNEVQKQASPLLARYK